jgi:ParB family chromosome partitioning protein
MSVQGKSLSRGLDSLLDPQQPRGLYRSGVGSMPIAAIRRGSMQPRTQFRPEALEELAASIKANGIIQPILVRSVPGFPHQFEIVAGDRRWQAAQLAGLTEIPAIVRELSDQEALALALVENIQREELTPTEEARALGRLIHEFSLTHQQVAEAVGRSRVAVTNLMRLLELPQPVIELVDGQSISMGHARALLGLGDEGARVEMAKLVVERQLSVRETELRVRKAQRPPAPREAAVSVVSEVVRTANARVQLHQRPSGAGKLVIDFADDATRDELLRAVAAALGA